MYLGVCVDHYKYENESETKRLERLAKMGVKYVNFIGKERKLGWMTKQELEEEKKVIDDNGIVPVQGQGGIPAWGSFDPADAKKILDDVPRFLDQLKYLGNTSTCVLPPVWSMEMSKEVSWGTSIEYYRKYAKMCADRELAIAVELEPKMEHISADFHDGIKWMEDVNADNMYMNVDTGHYLLWQVKSEWMKKFAPMCIQLHLTDTDIDHHEGWTLGTGDVDIVGLVRNLIEGGIEKTAENAGVPCAALLELWMPRGTETIYDQHVKDSLKWCAENLPELKLR